VQPFTKNVVEEWPFPANAIGRIPITVLTDSVRLNLIRRAFRLEWFTAGWMLIEASVAIGAGVAANSLSLIAFGADSLIELFSAGVLLCRLNVELRRRAEFPENVEYRASRIGGVLLFVLAAYVLVNAAYSLWRREGQEFSQSGLILEPDPKVCSVAPNCLLTAAAGNPEGGRTCE